MAEVNIDLGFKPRQWQRVCNLGWKGKRFAVIVVHRRGGKTVLAVMRLIDAALRTTMKAARYGYIAPQRNQAKSIAWDYLKHYALKIPGCSVSEQELSVELPNKARIRLFGADNPDSLRGQYFDGVVCDEVAQMKPEVWGEILLPALSDRRGWALHIGTPKGINLFSELYHKGLNAPDWYSASFDVHHTDALPADEIALAKQEMSDNQFRQEFLCDFTASSNTALISLDTVLEAQRVDPRTSIYDPLVLGVDVGRFGDDSSVLFWRRGRDARSIPIEKYRGLDTMQLAARVAAGIGLHRPEAVFVDEGGVGGGVVDRLRQLGHSVIGVNFGGKADSAVGGELVANKAAEMWCRMREWMQTGGAIPEDRELTAELTAREYGYTVHNEIVLERKEVMKKRGLPSPDVADALCLCFAHPVAERQSSGLERRRGKVVTDWNPFQGA